jgi:type IV secretory pathway VirB10-like protein
MKRKKEVLPADIMNDPNVQQAIQQVLAQKKPKDTAETKKSEPVPTAKEKEVNKKPDSVPKSKGKQEADVPDLPVVNDDDLSIYTKKTREKIIRNRKKTWEKRKRAASQKENKKIAHSILDTYPVRDYRFGKSGGYFILDDGSVFDFLHVTGQSYLHATADDLARLVNNNTIFHRMCSFEFNLYMLSVPTNARKHIEHIERVSQKTTNAVHLQMLEEEIKTCLWLEDNKPEKQAFYGIFALTPEQLLKNKEKAITHSVVPLNEMPLSLKRMLLFKLNNPNVTVRF